MPQLGRTRPNLPLRLLHNKPVAMDAVELVAPHAEVPLPVGGLGGCGLPHPRAALGFDEGGGGPHPDPPVAIDVSPPPRNPRPSGVPQPAPLGTLLFMPDFATV